MEKLERKLAEMDIRLCVMKLDRPGYYVPDLKTIIINQSLGKFEMKLAVLHEIKHALTHDEYSALYSSVVYRLKMEREANDYMLSEILKEHEGIFNYTGVIEKLKIGMGNEGFHLYKE